MPHLDSLKVIKRKQVERNIISSNVMIILRNLVLPHSLHLTGVTTQIRSFDCDITRDITRITYTVVK